MGWKFYPTNTLPARYSIVCCKWPQREDKNRPGSVVRPVLVRETMIFEDERTNSQYGALLISYMTGELDKEGRGKTDFLLEDRADWKAAGLHKPTRLSLEPRDRKQLPWCAEYFAPQPYLKNGAIVMGRLTDAQLARFKEALANRAAAKI